MTTKTTDVFQVEHIEYVTDRPLVDQHPDTWTSEGVKGGSNWSTPQGTPPSLVAPKAAPPWPPSNYKSSIPGGDVTRVWVRS